MKKLLLMSVILFLSLISFGQNDKVEPWTDTPTIKSFLGVNPKLSKDSIIKEFKKSGYIFNKEKESSNQVGVTITFFKKNKQTLTIWSNTFNKKTLAIQLSSPRYTDWKILKLKYYELKKQLILEYGKYNYIKENFQKEVGAYEGDGMELTDLAGGMADFSTIWQFPSIFKYEYWIDLTIDVYTDDINGGYVSLGFYDKDFLKYSKK